VKTFGRFSSHRRFEDRRIFPAGSLNQAIVGPTLSSWFTNRIQEERQEARHGSVTDCGANGRAFQGCVRFKSLEDLALDVVGRTVARVSVEEHMANYQAARALMGKGRNAGEGAAGLSKSRAKKGARKSAVKNHAAV
jgi:hypothetical protein